MSYRDQLTHNYSGFILDISSYTDQSTISSKIHHAGDFSDAFVISNFEKRSTEIFLVSTDGKTIEAIYLGEKKRMVTTERNKIEFTHGISIDPIEFENIQTDFLKKNVKSFVRPNSRGERIEWDQWSSFMRAIDKEFPDFFDVIIKVFSKRSVSYNPKDEYGVTSFKNDSTSLALDITEIDVNSKDAVLRISRNRNVSKIPSIDTKLLEDAEREMKSPDSRVPPWLRNKQTSSLREDAIITHDSQIFTDWERLGNTPDITAQFHQNGKTVTICNYNRHKVEEQLGLDLLYYHDYYKSYVLIQYKRLDSTGVYRPIDTSYHKEKRNFEKIERIVLESKVSDKDSGHIEDFRLSSEFLFFKLCEAKSIDYARNELIRGMYFPFSLWNQLLENDCTLGPKGGRRIGYNESKQRYFSNTQFLDLFKNGWVGSTDIGTKVITDLLEESLEQKRSVVIAVPGNQSQSSHRSVSSLIEVPGGVKSTDTKKNDGNPHSIRNMLDS